MPDRSPDIVRVAALSDTHIRTSSLARPEAFAGLGEIADVLLVAGDITDGGRIPEVEIAALAFADAPVPVFAVLGNHDRRGLRRMAMRKLLMAVGVDILDGEFRTLDLPNGARIAISGTTGTGGGFGGDAGPTARAARLARAVMAKSRREATRLDRVLDDVETRGADVHLLLTHFAPTVETLGHEPALKYWMLGNALLGNVIDDHRVDLAVHGHAHLGNPIGATPGGTPVRNVAVPDLGGIVVYHVGPGQQVTHVAGPLPGVVEPATAEHHEDAAEAPLVS